MHSCRGFRRITHGADRDAYYHEVSVTVSYHRVMEMSNQVTHFLNISTIFSAPISLFRSFSFAVGPTYIYA